jgi:hypothetical protein
MPDKPLAASSDVAKVRDELLNGLATIDVFAKAADKSVRTVQRLISEGKLPAVKIGRTPYVVIGKSRDAIMAQHTAYPQTA